MKVVNLLVSVALLICSLNLLLLSQSVRFQMNRRTRISGFGCSIVWPFLGLKLGVGSGPRGSGVNNASVTDTIKLTLPQTGMGPIMMTELGHSVSFHPLY